MRWKRFVFVMVCGVSLALAVGVARAQEDEREAKQFFKVFPVGTVEKKEGTTCLKIADEYGEALKGLDGFSHVIVLYWLHGNDTPEKRSTLQTRLERFSNKPLAGVFASRAPVRPNLIGLSVCQILSVDGNTVRVGSIDAFDGTPVLDLKPHIPNVDSPSNVKLPDWWRPPGFGGPLGQGRGGPGRGGPGGPGGGNFVEFVMGFDNNGDGKVTKDEMPERIEERLLQRADTNEDGALDKEEVKKFAEQMGQGPGGQGPGGPGTMGRGGPSRGGPGASGSGSFVERVMNFDKNGDGKVTKDEMPEQMQQRLLHRADANGDGAIDKQEAEQMAERFGRGGPGARGGRGGFRQ